MIYSKNEAFRDTSHHQIIYTMFTKKLRFLNKSYLNNIYIVLVLSFCYKEFEKFALCKSFSQSEATFIVYSEPIESGNVKINF